MDAALIYLGYFAGPSVNSIISSLSSHFTTIEILAALIAGLALFAWIGRSIKESKKEVEQVGLKLQFLY